MTKPKIDELKSFLTKTSLKDKYLKEIDKNVINYYLNIDGINQISKTKKITDFFN